MPGNGNSEPQWQYFYLNLEAFCTKTEEMLGLAEHVRCLTPREIISFSHLHAVVFLSIPEPRNLSRLSQTGLIVECTACALRPRGGVIVLHKHVGVSGLVPSVHEAGQLFMRLARLRCNYLEVALSPCTDDRFINIVCNDLVLQVVPHITDALQDWIVNVSKKPVDDSNEEVPFDLIISDII